MKVNLNNISAESTKKRLSSLVQILFTGLALYFVFTKIPYQKVWVNLQNANVIFLVSALLLFNLSKLNNTLRMDRFYRTLGLDLPILKHIKLYYVGMFYNLFLPGSISGDGYKIYLLRDQKTTNTKELFQATLLDRLNGSSVLTWLACVFLVFSDMAKLYTWLSVLGWLGIIFIFPIFFLFSNYLFPKFKEIFISTLIYSFAVQLLQVVCAICILKALSINSNHYDYLAFFLIGNAMTIIPISIGGVGIRELVMLYGLQFLSINKDEAVAFTLLFFTVTAITSLIGLFFTFSMSKELQNISKN